MAANIRCIMRAKAPYGQGITKMKVNLAPEQPTTPSLMPESTSVYLSRATEGTGELMELVGGSVAWNQLVPNGNFSDGTTGFTGGDSTLSASGGVLTMTATSTANRRVQFNISVPTGHKVLFHARFKRNSNESSQTLILLRKSGGGFDQYTRGNYASTAVQDYWAVIPTTDVITQCLFYPMQTGAVGDTVDIYSISVCDLTQMFGSTIADYVYSLEQASAGSGIAWLKSYGYFTEDYIAYSAPTLQSVEATSHIAKDGNGNVISTTTFGSVTLRGIPKLSNGNLYYDGDTYEWDGTVTRYFGERAYQAGDESLTDAITDGTNTVYKLNTPTTESADPFTAVQTVEDGGTEEFVTTNNVPVGVVGRFANAVPMEGVDSFTVTANDGTSHTYPVTLSEEIYRGYVDMLTGEAISDMASIAEYNGETISEPWLSSLDVYSAGATPTNGAQVVYPITAEEVTATITGDPSTLSGVVSATSTEGTVEWSELSEIGIKCIMKRKNPFQ